MTIGSALETGAASAVFVNRQVEVDWLVGALGTVLARAEATVDADRRRQVWVGQLIERRVDQLARMFD